MKNTMKNTINKKATQATLRGKITLLIKDATAAPAAVAVSSLRGIRDGARVTHIRVRTNESNQE
jgi:hypothetical protein